MVRYIVELTKMPLIILYKRPNTESQWIRIVLFNLQLSYDHEFVD